MKLFENRKRIPTSLLSMLMLLIFAFIGSYQVQSQNWQQEVHYEIDVKLTPKIHLIEGTEALTYTNHSPDTLDRVFFHLYWNAFQPGSMMDVRSRTIPDPDPRVGDRIGNLRKSEIGFIEVTQMNLNGIPCTLHQEGTILEVSIPQAIPPQSKVSFDLHFVAQVPLQIRRSGRFNKEGIEYSMSQWYPKICAYDKDGWHANPYIGREFYGTFGRFDVRLNAPNEYVIAATGILQNPEATAPHHKYAEVADLSGVYKDSETIDWHFKAERVHDFVWAADPDYEHDSYRADCGIDVHYFYQPDTAYAEKWKRLPQIMNRVFTYANERFGEYPYPTYSFIQGGDGGMEYPMATLITGNRSFPSLVGVSVHELMHSWYQGVIATDEGQYAWMDEGMTTYASGEIMNFLRKEGLLSGEAQADPHLRRVKGHNRLMESKIAEPLSTPADHFNLNTAYGIISYTSGAMVIHQLGYIIGEKARDKALRHYYREWKFKHPTPKDLIRSMERISGIELHWYYQYMQLMSEKVVNYRIDTVVNAELGMRLSLSNKGKRPMPLDIVIQTSDDERHLLHIPLRMMRGHKNLKAMGYDTADAANPWPWTHPNYNIILPYARADIQKIEIDPSQRLGDIDRSDNSWPFNKEEN
jgi:hypothetical protein